MKMVKFTLVSFVLLLSGISLTYSQMNVFYYENSHPTYLQSKAIDISEMANGNLLLMFRCSDINYKINALQLIEIDGQGKKVQDRIFEYENLHDIKRMYSFGNQEYRIYGNLFLNQLYTPTNITLNWETGDNQHSDEQVVYSTSIVDVVKTDLDKALMLLTKTGKNELYNITLNKFDLQSNKVDWFKKISSEQNEEADDIIPDYEGNIIILGKKYNDNITEYVPILYKLNPEGTLIWKKGLDIPSNFNAQSITVNPLGEILYACGYVKTQTGMSETRVMKYSKNGELISQVNLGEFSSNGILWLSSQKLLLYGSRFWVNTKQVVTKGAVIILDSELNEIFNKSLSLTDKPDVDFHYKSTSSSDIQAALELSNGKIVLSGKVFMPKNQDEQLKQNNPLVIFIEKY